MPTKQVRIAAFRTAFGKGCKMRFYFDFDDGDGATLMVDDVGVELSGRAEAMFVASEALASHGMEVLPGVEPRRISIMVRNSRKVIGTVTITIGFR